MIYCLHLSLLRTGASDDEGQAQTSEVLLLKRCIHQSKMFAGCS